MSLFLKLLDSFRCIHADRLLPATDREEGLREGKDRYHSATERETKREGKGRSILKHMRRRIN